MANPFPITDNNKHFGLTLLTDLRFMSQVIKTLLNFNPTLCPLNPIASTSMHPKNHGYGNKKLLVNVTINNARLRLNCSLCLSLGTTPIIEHRWHTQAHQRKQKKRITKRQPRPPMPGGPTKMHTPDRFASTLPASPVTKSCDISDQFVINTSLLNPPPALFLKYPS